MMEHIAWFILGFFVCGGLYDEIIIPRLYVRKGPLP